MQRAAGGTRGARGPWRAFFWGIAYWAVVVEPEVELEDESVVVLVLVLGVVAAALAGMATAPVVPLTSPVLPPDSTQVACMVRPVKTLAETVPWKVPVMVTCLPAALVPFVEKEATIVSPSRGNELVGPMPEAERMPLIRPVYLAPLLSVMVRFWPCWDTTKE